MAVRRVFRRATLIETFQIGARFLANLYYRSGGRAVSYVPKVVSLCSRPDASTKLVKIPSKPSIQNVLVLNMVRSHFLHSPGHLI